MRQRNYYTIILWWLGVLSTIGFIYSVTNQQEWLILSIMILVSIIYEIIPVQLPNGISYSVSTVGSIYIAYKYGPIAAFIPAFFGAFIFYLVKTGIKQFPWYRFFVTYGMYAISFITAWIVWKLLDTPYVFIDILTIAFISDSTCLVLREGIIKSLHGGSLFRKPTFNSAVNFLLPIIVCSLVVIQLVLSETFTQWIWNIGLTSFFVLLVFYLTSAYHKQLVSVEENSQKFQSLYDNNPDIVLTVDKEGTILEANPRLTDGLGYRKDEIIGWNIFTLLYAEQKDNEGNRFSSLLNGRAVIQTALMKHFDGSLREFFVTTVPTVVKTHVVGAFIIAKDITLEKEAERMVEKMAYYDSVTGLPNRVLVMERLRQEIRNAEKQRTRIGVLYIDFDHFKIINDTYGHAMGDLMLVKASERILQAAPSNALAARLGGDEFLLLLPGRDSAACEAVASNLLQAFNRSVMLEEQSVFITPSIGISVYPTYGLIADELVSQADSAMYRAKHTGGANYLLFAPDMLQEHEDNKRISKFLRNCIDEGELWLQYQPQYDLKQGKITGVEALVRWTNPILGQIPPSKFIPIAEQGNLILPIGNWILKTACRQNKMWQDAGYPSLKMAVNISSIQLMQGNFVDIVRNTLLETGLEAKWLELELTESVLIQNTARNLQVLNELKQLGVSIALDDFGIGYSSLGYLNRFSIDYIKIDRSFVKNIGQNASDEAIIRTIIRLAKELKMDVIAEGIETKEQFEFVKVENCDLIQGYYIHRPLGSDEFETKIWNGPETE